MGNELNELLKRELIGTNVHIIGKNIQGRIIDETKNMFVIKSKKDIKKIIKKNSQMELTMKKL